MPLPAALAARLAKRGIVSAKKSAARKRSQEVEEVFAEDYDDTNEHIDSDQDSDNEGERVFESIACPNKTNPYHICVGFCKTKWGAYTFKGDTGMKRKRDRMIKKYPLPSGWLEVGDPETNRYYYWNTETDEVSWFSPSHPRAKVVASASKFPPKPTVSSGILSDGSDQEDEDEEQEMDLDMDDADFEKLEREIMKEKEENEARQQRHDKGGRGGKRGRERVKEELDPMDPASYSDIPRGSWSDGLERTGPKTGADTTASGPLFQQRPYPSPGAVLRMNKEKP